jgi:hypothetical protein
MSQPVDANVEAFVAVNNMLVYVIGTDHNLWQEDGPWGAVPPSRVLQDRNVRACQPAPGASPAKGSTVPPVLVLRTDGTLWLEYFPTSFKFKAGIGPANVGVARNVSAFSAVDESTVFVLDQDSKLWRLSGPFGESAPSEPIIVDENVQAFSPVTVSCAIAVPVSTGILPGTTTAGGILVLGIDGTLWLELPEFGTVPPHRVIVETEVSLFQTPAWLIPDTGYQVYLVRESYQLLFQEVPTGSAPHRGPGDGPLATGVTAFQGLANPIGALFILFDEGGLDLIWEPYDNPENHYSVSDNVVSFQAVSPTEVYVLSADGFLSLVQVPSIPGG